MEQIAVFVDAGHIYAQGSILITGVKLKRQQIILFAEPLIEHFRSLARQIAPNARLLRIYWYDGLRRGGRLSGDQEAIGLLHDCKLRLGLLNVEGKQKGVDSLIVTDLIDLARNKAMTDALVVSGDEDIRVGVAIAQSYGVRIHLFGIESISKSQSIDLLREADSHLEFCSADVSAWMKVRPQDDGATLHSKLPTSPTVNAAVESLTKEIVAHLVAEKDPDELRRFAKQLEKNPKQIPGDIDRPLLKKLTDRLGRDPNEAEKRTMREVASCEIREIGR